MKETLARKKKWMLVGLAVFLMTASLAIAVNSLVCGHGLVVSRSISRYVGFEVWSAVVFALGNFLAVATTTSFLWGLGEAWKMPRIYYYMTFLMGLGLVCLSIWPIGYFDTEAGKSIISYAHEISSRTMFAMMLLVALMLVLKRGYGAKKSKVVAMLFLIYGVACMLGYFTKGGWFMSYFMFYEGFYIVAFLLVLASQKDKLVE